MTWPMKRECRRARQALLLDPPSETGFRAHAERCPTCQKLLSSMEEIRRATDLCSGETMDDLARMRIQSRLNEALSSEPERHSSASKRPVWLWPAVTVGATAILVLVALGVAFRANRREPPAARGAARQVARDLLIPYAASGSWLSEPATRRILGSRSDRLVVPSRATVRAAVDRRGQVALRGRAELQVERAAPHRLDIRLKGGLVLAQVQHSDEQQLWLRTDGLTVIVVGTTFAVDARRAGLPRVTVLEGLVVAHATDGKRQAVGAGQSWTPGSAVSPADPAVARELAEMRQGLSPPSGDVGILILRGTPEPALVASSEFSTTLGETPLAVQLPVGPKRLVLRAPRRVAAGLDVQIEKGQTTLVQYALAPQSEPAVESKPASGSAAAPTELVPPPRQARPARHTVAEDLYARAEASLRGGDAPGAEKLLAELVRRFPHDASAGAALYELARLSYERGDKQAADSHLRAVMNNRRFRSLHDPSHFLLCKIGAEERRNDEAVACFRGYRRQHPRSAHDQEALYTLAQLVELSQGCAAARPLLDEYLERYPRGALAAKVAARRSRCP